MEAIKKKNLLQIKKMNLEINRWINFATNRVTSVRSNVYYSPLTWACETGDIRIVKYLLEKKAKVNGVPNEEYNPLYGACVSGKKEIVDLLLEKKAKINKANKSGMTAVFGAVQGDNLELIKYLESKGADLTVKSTKGGLVQHASSAHKAPKCLSYFMEKKLEVNTYDESGQSALYRLCISYLANKKDEKKKKPLLDSMKKLIDAGADPNVLSKRDEKEETPLHLVCKYDSTCEELIKFLLDNGANPNIKSSRDDTPLLNMFFLKREQGSKSRKAVSKRCLEIMFQHKADPNIPNKSGITPFLYLMSSHIHHQIKTDIELVKLFLENGADVTSVDFKKNTPLHLAAGKASSEVCKLLIDYKADVRRYECE